MITKEIRIEDTHDLREFMSLLKSWAENHNEKSIYSRLVDAEQRARSASELIIEYELALKEIRSKSLNRLPANFQALIEKGERVAADAVNLESYTYQKKSAGK